MALATMLQKKFFVGKTREEIISSAKKEGFSPELVHDTANFVYDQHMHNETKLLVCLEGSMQITIDGTSFLFECGDKLIISGNTLHSAVVGSSGCTYFWSEKL